MSRDTAIYRLYFHRESPAALLLSERHDSKPFWLPRSLVPYLRRTGDFRHDREIWEVEIPDWKADELHLVISP